jgi:phosphotriesterase-related protein
MTNKFLSLRSVYNLIIISFLLASCSSTKEGEIIMTVTGPVKANQMGVTLTHEHILVDFIGADSINESRWNKTNVVEKGVASLERAPSTSYC